MDEEKVRELARRIVEVCAPDELDLFDADADAYFADPVRARAGDPVRDRPLASGLSHAIHALTPIALYLSDHLSNVLADQVIEQSGGQVRAGWRKRRKSRKGSPAAPPPLAAFEVRSSGNERDRTVGIVVVIANQDFPMGAEQAARLMITLVTELGSGQGQAPPTAEG